MAGDETDALRALADELRRASGAIARCDFRRPAARALPLRPTPATSSLAGGPPRALPTAPAAATAAASTGSAEATAPSLRARESLFSLVSAAAYSAKRSAASRRPQSWQDALRRLATELEGPEPMERFERLRRRNESLTAATRLLEERLRRPADEVSLNNRVESQLEREEQEWEAQMQVREQTVAELEVELNALRDGEQESDDADEPDEDEDVDEDEGEQPDNEGDSDEETKGGRGRESVTRMEARGRELREALALRAEEKRDIEAAIESLRRKRRRRAPSSGAENDGAEGSAKRPRLESERLRELEGELITLRSEKDALEREILAAEKRSEELDEHKSELPRLREEIDARRDERDALQARVDSRKLQLGRLKHKMQYMVDVQLLTARDTSPPTLREEAVLLHLLYEHAGELGVNELKQQTAAIMQEHGKPPNSAAVIRALYSLVANGVVQIDRSYGNGLVTSLLV